MKNALAIFSLTVLSFFVFHNFLLAGIVTNGDWQFQFAKTLVEWLSSPFIWVSRGGFGGVDIGGLSGWPYYFFHGIFGYFGFDSGTSNKFIVFIPAILSSVVGSYLLVKKVTGSILGAFIGSLIFVYNTYFLIIATGGSWLLLTAFSVAPLALLLYICAIEKNKASISVLTGFVCFIVSYYEFRAFYVLAGVMALYLLFTLLLDRKKPLLVGLIPFVIVALLNFYWVVGLLSARALSDNAILNRQLFGSSFMNVRQAMTLFHPFWSGGRGESFKVYSVPVQFFLVPIFAFLGFYLSRHNRKILFWGVLAVIGVLLAKQDSEPFGFIYRWLFSTFPGFKAFRESSKFYFLTSLSYSVLIGMFVAWLMAKKTQFKYLIFCLIVAIFVWNTKSVITGEAGGLAQPRMIPSDYILVRNFLQKDSTFSRVLWIPEPSRWSFYSSLHPKVSLIQSNQTIWKEYSKYGEFTNDIPVEKQSGYLLKQPNFQKILELSSIKYVMVPIQDIANDDDISYNCQEAKKSFSPGDRPQR